MTPFRPEFTEPRGVDVGLGMGEAAADAGSDGILSNGDGGDEMFEMLDCNPTCCWLGDEPGDLRLNLGLCLNRAESRPPEFGVVVFGEGLGDDDSYRAPPDEPEAEE